MNARARSTAAQAGRSRNSAVSGCSSEGCPVHASSADAIVELLRCRVLRLAVRQQNLRRAHLENHVADFRIADVAEILRREQDDPVHPPKRLQPIAKPFAENIVPEICPGFVERHQRRRAVQSLFDPRNRYSRTGITALSSSWRRFSVSNVRKRPELRTSSSASSSWPSGPDSV